MDKLYDTLYDTLDTVFDFYVSEPADEDTLRHINIRAQTILPGPYVIVYTYNLRYNVIFKFASPQEKTWYTLKWS